VRKWGFPKSTLAVISGLLAACLSCARSSLPTIAFIPQTTADDLWEPAHLGSLDATTKTGYSIYWNGPTSNNDIQTQIDLLDEAVDRHSAGMILAPDHPLALMMPVRRAVMSGMPLVVIGSPLPLVPSGKLFYVLNDEEEVGRIAARRIGEQLDGKGFVAILGLNPDNGGVFLRMRSFEVTLTQEFPGITILSRHMGSNSEAQAEQAAHALLTGSRRPDAILALTRTATTGALRAIENGGQSKRIILVGCDQNYGLLYNLSLGKIDSIIAENTYAMGYQAAQLILSARSESSGASTVYIKPILITRANLYSPELLNVLTHDARVRH
jgi:ribose transport system substrate-binding protein